MVVTKTEFPVVHLTAQARRVLFEGERVLASLAVPTREAPALPQTEAAEPVGPLMGELKALRTRLAQAEGVPAYIIFSNATLAGMAAKLPTTMPSTGRDWNTVRGTSPVPGGMSTNR